MKKLLLLVLITIFALSTYAQHKKFNPNPWNGLNGVQASVGYGNHLEGEVSYLMTSYPRNTVEPDYGVFMGFQSISVGVNYANSKDLSFIGPKIYYQMTYAIFAGQLGFDYMTDFNSNYQYRFTPKAGISFFGYFSVLYGRSYNLKGNMDGNDLVNKGAITLQAQIPFDWF